MAQSKHLEEEVSRVDRADRSRATDRNAARMARRMANSCATVNDIFASFLPVRDIGEGRDVVIASLRSRLL
jgi:hypothetical protein